MPQPFGNPMMALLADMSGTILEGVATAQKDWADFVHRRIKEDVAFTRRLAHSQSFADMQQVYSQFFQTAFDQYREQSQKVAKRSESTAQHLIETAEASAKEASRAHH
jgi:hypothetical protein